MGIAQVILWGVFCLPFVFVYRLLVKMQAGDRSGRHEPTKTWGGDGTIDGNGAGF